MALASCFASVLASWDERGYQRAAGARLWLDLLRAALAAGAVTLGAGLMGSAVWRVARRERPRGEGRAGD